MLQSSDFVDISGYRVPSINICSTGSVELRYAYRSGPLPFPPNTRGFLYYHRPGNLPPGCGELRFRLTADNDPTKFLEGTDLIGYDATPWSISFSTLIIGRYAPIRKHLVHYNLIPQSVVTSVEKLREARAMMKTSPRELYYLEQPFMFDMETHHLNFRAITATQVRTMSLRQFFVDFREQAFLLAYKGRLLLRFERSKLLDHAETNTVVLRVLKILDPIKFNIPGYDAYIPLPQAGGLLLMRKSSRVGVRSWDLDDETDPVSLALRILPSDSTKKTPTLNPKHLKPSDFVDLSGSKHHPRFPTNYMFYAGTLQNPIAFPSNTRGFMYYYRDPALPPTSGEIRFRLTSGSDPATFRDGSDLQNPTGATWSSQHWG
ncbi:hypothetical protein C0991_005544 [Blastosporella zonata]|nr:hypothetical protein C0991_005544 [Blastosporella zonata]